MDIQKIIDDLQDFSCKLERLPVLISQVSKNIGEMELPGDEARSALEDLELMTDSIHELAQLRNSDLNTLIRRIELQRDAIEAER